MNSTLREVMSQVKVPNKGVNADSRITSRYIYSLLKKHRDYLIKQIDSKFYLYELSYLFRPFDCIEVIPVPNISECCNVKTNCKIYRTKNKLPRIINGYKGPIIRSVLSIDGSTKLLQITDLEWNRKLENPDMVKYDKGKYYFWKNDYLYFPNNHWKKIQVEAYFLEDAVNDCNKEEKCVSILDRPFKIPTDLLAQCVLAVNQELSIYQQVPDDVQPDKNPNRKN